MDKQADRVSSVFDDLLHSSKHRLRKRSTRVYEEESPHYPCPCSPGRQDGARGGWDLLTPPHTHLPPPEGSACSVDGSGNDESRTRDWQTGGSHRKSL